MNDKNLAPFRKGEPSKNPSGRPRGSKNRVTILNQWLKLKIKFDNKAKNEFNEETGEKVFEGKGFDFKITVHDAVVLALIQEAQNGNVAAIKEIQDTIYGKISNRQELTGADGAELLPATTIIQNIFTDNAPEELTEGDY